ncbi:MAG: hypothetical protein J7M12_05785, partial [Candidatus Hydrogenedentes bacterium]|nr:hypothetical protein [Candidatus Hydrogenedentota bacterium]
MMWWDEIAEKSAETDQAGSFWTDLERRISYLDMVPRKSETAECIEVRERQTGTHFVLRDPERATFMRLAPEEYRIWDLIDGKHRVRDIVNTYLGRGGWFSFERISRFIDELERKGLLETVHADVYAELSERLGHRRFGPVFDAIKRISDFSVIEIPWLDRVAERLARWSDLVPKARWILLTMAGLVAGSGGWLFFWTMRNGTYSPLRIGGSYEFGLTVLVIAYFMAVNIGQMVRAVGARILGFSLDQSQFRMGSRGIEIVPYGADFALATIRERALMNFGRMFALLVLGGLGGTVAYFVRPDANMVGEIGFVAGSAAYLSLFMEIMPFGGSAAYRLFSEWSGIPGLRSRAIRYVLRQMAPRILGRHLFKRSDKIMLLYCGWCVLWLATMTQVCVAVAGKEGPRLVRQVFEGQPTVAGIAAMAILVAMGVVTAVYAVGVTLFVILGFARYMLREGLLRRPGARAAASAIGWSIICLAMLILTHNRSETGAFVCAAIGAVTTLAAARLLRWRRDVTVCRYHWITAAAGLLTLSFFVLGVFYTTGETMSVAAVRLSDSTVIAVF